MAGTFTMTESDQPAVWYYDAQNRALHVVKLVWQSTWHCTIRDSKGAELTVPANRLVSPTLAQLLLAENQAVEYESLRR